jgi:hypothetical protein
MRKTMVMALPGMDKVCIGLKNRMGRQFEIRHGHFQPHGHRIIR